MDILGDILRDWLLCSADGGSIPATCIHQVVECARLRIKSSHASEESELDAYRLICSKEDGLPAVFNLICVGSDRGFYAERFAAIHFLTFWKAFHELCRSLGQVESQKDDPLSEELSEFRDGLLRHLRCEGRITGHELTQSIARAQVASTDRGAWSAFMNVAQSMNANSHIRADEMSMKVFQWLKELTRDYCHGERNRMIWSVRDVVGCGRREACFRLGNCSWDVEVALRQFYAYRDPPNARDACMTSWSSQGAKLRECEVECPICVEAYTSTSPSVELQCCFQVICRPCGQKLMNACGQLMCPYCRSTAKFSMPDSPMRAQLTSGSPLKRRDSSLAGLRSLLAPLQNRSHEWVNRRRAASVGSTATRIRF